ncbi:GTP cyclohydrolase I [Melittangium boletus]|uniref:GTP cyclohydrolase I n=1 Tax=Melittangium boletus TaxID=83453 RepID=UPI003DA68BF0
MAAAIQAFLDAAGVKTEGDPNLAQTPERVAEAWTEEFLDGYGRTPEEALGELFPAPRDSVGELVVVTDLRFHSMCPHHLLPVAGRAHVAYVPSKQVTGFGRLGELVDCFAHRLILQEDLAREVAQSLARVLDSPATACIIEAEQACLRLRGPRQRDAVTHSEAYEGLLRGDGALRRELWARLTLARR